MHSFIEKDLKRFIFVKNSLKDRSYYRALKVEIRKIKILICFYWENI